MADQTIDIGRLNADAKRMILRLTEVSNNLNRDGKEIFDKAAQPLIAAIQANAPESDAPHHRYTSGNGYDDVGTSGGRIVATYMPGNLKRSFAKTLRFGRSAAVWVAPKLAKGESATGTFSGSRTDAYYAHMVEFGTYDNPGKPFVRPAFEATKDQVARIAIAMIKARLKRYNAQV